VRLRAYSSEGVILARKNYSEADRIVVIFSKSYGKVRLIAKGVRYPKSRKRGHLEIFTRIKYSATKSYGMDILTEVETINFFENTRKNLKKTALAYYLVEVIGRLIAEEERNIDLYYHLLKTLTKLETATNLKTLRKDFVSDSLKLLGFWPRTKIMDDPDKILEEVIEKKVSSARVGKRLLT